MSYTDTTKLGLKKAVPNSNQPFETTVMNDNWDAVDAEAVAVDARLDAVEANNWVTNARLADNSVGSAELQAGSVVAGKLGVNSVSSTELATYAVTTDKIAPNAVTPDKIPNGSIGADEIAANAINAGHLQPNSVGSSEIAPGAVGDEELNGGLNASKLAYGTLNPGLLPDYGVPDFKLSNSLDFTAKDVFVGGGYVSPTSVANHEVAYNYAVGQVNTFASDRNVPTKFASGSVTATPSSGLITIDLTSYGFTAVPVVTGNIFGAATTKMILSLNAVSATSVQFKVWTSTFASSTTSTRIDWVAVQD
jgi:hypothetical protein